MSPAEGEEQKDEKNISREERLEKLRDLISARGEDAAKVLKMWLQQNNEDGGRGRR